MTPTINPSATTRKFYDHFNADLVNKVITNENNGYISYYDQAKASYEASVAAYETKLANY